MPDGTTEELRDRVRSCEQEIDRLRADLRDARMTGTAVGVLLARTPGWTEHDAWAAWADACTRWTRGGNHGALASFVVQTGGLPADVATVVV